MTDANKIIPVEIDELYSRKYSLRLKQEKEEQICLETQEKSSKE